MGCDMGYQCIRVTTRSGRLSPSGPLVCHTTHTRAFSWTHDTRASTSSMEHVRSFFLTFMPFNYSRGLDSNFWINVALYVIFLSHDLFCFEPVNRARVPAAVSRSN